MAAGAIASLHGMRSGGRGRMPHLVMLALFIIMGALSKSTTSLMVIFVFCGADIVIRLFRKGGAARTMAMVAVVFLVPTALFFAMFPDSLLELIGKDPTLTGRTELWAYVMADIGKKPFLGWGYSAFWSPNDPAAVEISTILMWYVPQAHNGLLEMLLNVGMIGSALFIFMWGRNIRLALRCLRSGQQAVAISALYACGGIFLFGISETVLMEPLQIGTTLFFVMGFMCEKAMRAARRKPFRTAFPTNRPLPA
jgi:O-antigen ligase